MKGEIEYLRSDGYVEMEARRNLLWGLPGEKLIITQDASKTPVAVPTRQR